jgi:hypothetical protein
MYSVLTQSYIRTTFDPEQIPAQHIFSRPAYSTKWKGSNELGAQYVQQMTHNINWRRGSSVSKVSNYRLHDRGSITCRAKNYSCTHSMQTGYGYHPTSCTVGPEGPFPGVKRGRNVMLTTHPFLVPRLRKRRSYTSSPPKRHYGVQRDHFTFYNKQNGQKSVKQPKVRKPFSADFLDTL